MSWICIGNAILFSPTLAWGRSPDHVETVQICGCEGRRGVVSGGGKDWGVGLDKQLRQSLISASRA